MTLVCDPNARGKVPETRWSVLLGLLLSLALGVVTPAFALTTYYVAPNWAGSQNGTASQPWTSLSASGAWTAINASLATDDVTVYFTARKAASDTDTSVTQPLSIERTNGSTHRLTLDGMSQYNTNDSAPSWAAYTGASRFKITASSDVVTTNNSFASPLLPRNYITVRGFKVVAAGTATSGTHGAFLANISNFIFELNDVTNTNPDNGGNGILLGSQADQVGTFGTNPTIRNNTVHDCPAECMYIGGYYNQGAASTTVSWTNLLIENNTIQNAGRVGEGNCIDVKDGTINTIIRGNTCQQLTQPTPPAYSDIGIVVESVAVIERNYVANFAAGIGTAGFYNNSNSRSNAEIRNNIIVGSVHGTGNIWDTSVVIGESTLAETHWDGTKFYNNTVYGGNANGFQIRSGANPATNVVIENNIIAENASLQLTAPAGTITTHTNNTYRKASGGNLVTVGSSSYTAGAITSFEATAKAADPLLVNPTVGAGAAGFKLQATSPAIGTAITLGSFSNDYMGQTRIAPWDMGAWASLSATSTRPQPPTSLSLQ